VKSVSGGFEFSVFGFRFSKDERYEFDLHGLRRRR
jgi:hypothetical protein